MLSTRRVTNTLADGARVQVRVRENLRASSAGRVFSRGTQGQGDRGQETILQVWGVSVSHPNPQPPVPVQAVPEVWVRGLDEGVHQRGGGPRRGGAPVREVIATSENMLPRGVEHDFALNSLGGGGGWSKDEQPEVV